MVVAVVRWRKEPESHLESWVSADAFSRSNLEDALYCRA